MEDDRNKNRFLWGVLLAWAPWVPTLIVLVYFFIGISNSKATGLAAIAGGLVELLVWWGLAAMIISQFVALVWLVRSLSDARTLRSMVAAASILASGVTLIMVFAFLIWGRRLLESGATR